MRPHSANVGVSQARLMERLAREPIGFLTQSLLEKSHEQTRDLTSSRRKCTFRDGGVRRPAFRRHISRTGEQPSKRSHGLQ
jgi:hypothetical protein